ncbi:S-layer homology domain-containing protein [Cellulomonas sp. URHE0023]|uniref:S-layer homology domain-containing protein n=1 Tax=Cellulomonas sp. URHE0023 TaxID=1380354 RepID=UPI0018CC6499|nr:S-layer homology domain-containing protein [Cellulomonas sp. URHE0023]
MTNVRTGRTSRGAALVATLSAFFVLLGLGFSPASAAGAESQPGIDSALATGSISGTVTVPAGQSLADVLVTAATSGLYQSTQVNTETGAWSIAGLPAGQYYVAVYPAAGSPLLNGYYPGDVTVRAGEETAGIDVELSLSGTLRGVVSGPDGPIAGVSVQVMSPNQDTPTLLDTDANGAYVLDDLRPDDYTIVFLPPSGSHVVSAFYPGVAAPEDAQPVHVGPGADVVANVVLSESASVSGTVTQPDGTPLTGLGRVEIQSASGAAQAFAAIGADGSWEVQDDLPPGTYTASATAFDTELGTWFYPSAPTWETATPFTVVLGVQTTGIDIRLGGSATLRLALTTPAGDPATPVEVQLIQPDGAWTPSEPTGADGSLRLTTQKLGASRIVFGAGPADTPFVAQYFKAPNGTTLDEADASAIMLTGGQTTEIAAQLRTGAKITGALRKADGSPLVGQQVKAYVESATPPSTVPLAARFATTGADGSYTIQGLLPGAYLVSTDSAPGAVFYRTGLVHGAPNVVVVGTSTTPKIDITVGTTFGDVQPTAPFAADIEWIAAQGILAGVTAPDGSATFGSTGTETRADLAAALFRAAGSPAQRAPKSSPFTDVPSTHPQYAAIVWAASHGYVLGSRVHGKTVFRPGNVVTRSEAAGAIYRFAGSPRVARSQHGKFADVGWRTPEHDAIVWLGELGVTSGGTNAYGRPVFRPAANLERGAFAEALHKAVAVKH